MTISVLKHQWISGYLQSYEKMNQNFYISSKTGVIAAESISTTEKGPHQYKQ